MEHHTERQGEAEKWCHLLSVFQENQQGHTAGTLVPNTYLAETCRGSSKLQQRCKMHQQTAFDRTFDHATPNLSEYAKHNLTIHG